jgi:hypothetical protein
MTDDAIVRVRYFDRQYLRPQDLTDEQDYHVAMRRRHAIAGHSWGIVRGLALTPADRQVYVEPGLAVDGYGREVVLAARTPVRLPPTGSTFEVWLRYDRVGTDPAPAGYAGCGPGATAFYRWQEAPRLEVRESTDLPQARNPPGVPPGDLRFGPERTAPDEESRWPVFLGRISRDLTRPAEPATVDGSGRPYAGLVGDRVEAVSGGAVIRLADDFVVEAHGRRLLAVSDEGADLQTGLDVAGALSARALELHAPAPAPAPVPKPWSLYRVTGGAREELRVEVPPGGDFVVGTWSADQQAFVPCLTVAADQTVTVHGALHVDGVLTAAGGVVEGGLDPEADRLVTAALLSGITGASGLANRLFRPGSDPTAALPGVLAAALAGDPELSRAVAARLRTGHGAAADLLASQLAAPSGPAG